MSKRSPEAPRVHLLSAPADSWPRRIKITNTHSAPIHDVRIWVMDEFGGYAPQSTEVIERLEAGAATVVPAPETSRLFSDSISDVWMQVTFRVGDEWWTADSGGRVEPTTVERIDRRISIQ